MSEFELSFVVPAFNEENRLGKTIDRVFEYLSYRRINGEIIVVNDGSQDRTCKVAVEHGAKCLSYERNRGIAYAFRRGAKLASGSYTVFMPADLDSMEVLDNLLFALKRGSDVVQTSKRHPESEVIGFSKTRWVFSNNWNRMVRLMFQVPYSDTDFVRAFKQTVLHTILPECRVDRAAGEPELIIRAHRAGFKIQIVPCKIVHTEKGRVNLKFMFESLIALTSLKVQLAIEDLRRRRAFVPVKFIHD